MTPDELSPAELAQATGKRRAASQAAALARMGVPFVFSGESAQVLRGIAVAHGVITPPAPTPIAQEASYPQFKPLGRRDRTARIHVSVVALWGRSLVRISPS